MPPFQLILSGTLKKAKTAKRQDENTVIVLHLCVQLLDQQVDQQQVADQSKACGCINTEHTVISNGHFGEAQIAAVIT